MSSRFGILLVLILACAAVWAGQHYGYYNWPWESKVAPPAPVVAPQTSTPVVAAPVHEHSIFDMTPDSNAPAHQSPPPQVATPGVTVFKAPPPAPAVNAGESLAGIQARLHSDTLALTAAEQHVRDGLQNDSRYRDAKAAKEAASEAAQAALTGGDDAAHAQAVKDLTAKMQTVADMEQAAYRADPAVIAARAQVDKDQQEQAAAARKTSGK